MFADACRVSESGILIDLHKIVRNTKNPFESNDPQIREWRVLKGLHLT